MELIDAINNRRSIRNYKNQVVEKSAIDKILQAAVQAPSAMNSQPWAFAVIQNSELLQMYSDRAKGYLLSALEKNPLLIKYRAVLSKPDFNIFYNANTLIIIYAKPEGPHPVEDCCLAAQNLMLAAHSLGLGTCWIGFASALLNLREVKNELGVPEEYIATAPIIIGHPQSAVPDIPKKAPEIIFWK